MSEVVEDTDIAVWVERVRVARDAVDAAAAARRVAQAALNAAEDTHRTAYKAFSELQQGLLAAAIGDDKPRWT